MLLNLCICISLIGSPAYAKNKAKDQSKEEDEVIVVSLGDSYSAGEGIEPFYGQGLAVKEKVSNKDWLAHRSEKSWPGQLTVPGLEGTLADHKGKNWFFAAASGAVTANLNGEQKKKYNKGRFKGEYKLPPQLSVFKQIGNRQVDYVTLTFGGNDVGFSGIVQDSVTDTARNSVATMGGNPFLDPNNLSTRLNETWAEFRPHAEISGRAFEEISPVEIANAWRYFDANPELLDDGQDVQSAVLATFGRKRCTAVVKKHLELAKTLI